MKRERELNRANTLNIFSDNIINSLAAGYLGFAGNFTLIVLAKIIALLFGFIKELDVNSNDILFSGLSFGIFFLSSFIIQLRQSNKKNRNLDI